MKEIKFIKELFRPIQPTIKNENSTSYSEVKPKTELSNLVFCYWQLKSEETFSEKFIYQVVSDGCLDIFWEIENPDESYLTGFTNRYAEFELEKGFNYIGIRFLPTALPFLFNTDASELTNRFEPLAMISPKFSSNLSECAEGVLDLQDIKLRLDSFLSHWISNSTFSYDSRLLNALEIILQSKGTLSVENDLNVGISKRQLRRLFHFYIGDSPKSFCKVVRFQNLLKTMPSKELLRQDKLYYDFGYFDQTHFIKEFKHFYGSTPSKAF